MHAPPPKPTATYWISVVREPGKWCLLAWWTATSKPAATSEWRPGSGPGRKVYNDLVAELRATMAKAYPDAVEDWPEVKPSLRRRMRLTFQRGQVAA